MIKLLSLYKRSGMGRAFRHRDFSVYVIAHSASVVGLWVQRIAIQWLVWSLTGSYAWLGTIALAEALASMFFSIAAGPFADRFDRVRMAYVTQGLLMIVAFGLAIVTYFNLISIPVITVFVLLMGTLEGIWAPVRLALMPNLVPREDMPAAVSITSMMFTLAIFIGPAIGGQVIAWFDVEGAFIANSISYFGLLLVFSRIKLKQQASDATVKRGLFTDLVSGFIFTMQNPALRAPIVFGAAFSLLIRPYRELFAGIADEVFQRGAGGLAALASASGFGALIGASAIALYGRTRGLSITLYVVAASTVTMLIAFALSKNFLVSLIMTAGLSACVTIFSTGAQMLLQMSVSDNMRGRVMSVWQAQFRGVPTIGAAIVGVLELYLDLPIVLVGSALLFLLFIFWGIKWRTHFKQLESEALSP